MDGEDSPGRVRRGPLTVGYEYSRAKEAQEHARELDRRFSREELAGLRVYQIRWNGHYLVEAIFSPSAAEQRIMDARALLGESGTPVHPDDLRDYKQATVTTERGPMPDWIRRLFGG